MKLTFAAMAAAVLSHATPATAASLCNCCGSTTSQSCTNACAPVKPVDGQCVATVDYEGAAEISTGLNPLYEVPLRNMSLGSPSRSQLELFRQLLESARRGAETDRKAALRAYRNGKNDNAEAARLAKRYDEAMVNYYLGMQSYRLGR